MTRAIILHGRPDRDEYFSDRFPSASNAHWLGWLQNQLLIAGYDAQTPEVVNAYQPEYAIWRQEFERHLVDDPMVLVGHSTGAGFIVRWTSEHPANRIDKLVLVAPYLDPDDAFGNDFFEFNIDDSIINRVNEFHIFSSSDDMDSVTKSVDILLKHFPDAIHHRYDDMGHFCHEDMGTDAFPDLLHAITGS